MKKRKTYEISVIDKTYSKIISDETKFYTSDTALELGFELKETEYSFESAEIALLNIDDRSLVTRSVAKNFDGFAYELEDDIIAHYGEWHVQLRFEQSGEIYVSSPVKFRIENDLSNGRPPQLSDVQSWVSLKRYADSLTEELKQAVLDVDGMDDTFKANELERQSQFETAEQSRQTTFTTNEANRTENFNTNEATRKANEEARELAENERENAETQRKIDHANRSAELAGKANKKQEDWITPTLLNGWVGAPGFSVGYYKDDFGIVRLRGRIMSGVMPSVMFILPVGYRPKQSYTVPMLTANKIDYISVASLGSVSTSSTSNNALVVLDSIQFKVEG